MKKINKLKYSMKSWKKCDEDLDEAQRRWITAKRSVGRDVFKEIQKQLSRTKRGKDVTYNKDESVIHYCRRRTVIRTRRYYGRKKKEEYEHIDKLFRLLIIDAESFKIIGLPGKFYNYRHIDTAIRRFVKEVIIK